MKALKVLIVVAVTAVTIAAASEANSSDCSNRKNGITKEHGFKMHKQMRKRFNQNRRFNRILRSLNLTDSQKDKLVEIRKDMRKSRKEAMQDLRRNGGFKKFISTKGFDKEGFLADAKQRGKKIIELRANMFEKIIAILTPEQREELIKKLNKKPRFKGN